MRRAVLVGIVVAHAGLARADEVPPYEPVHPPRPIPVRLAHPSTEALVVHYAAPPPVRTRIIDVAFGYPMKSNVATGDRVTRGQSFALDATVRWKLGGGFDVGATLGFLEWRNYQTSYRAGMDHAVRVLAAGRYAYGDGAFKPYARIAGGVGLSVMAPEFTVYNPIDGYAPHGTTIVDDRDGLALIGELAVGFRRALDRRWEVLGEVCGHAMLVRHHLRFEPEVGDPSTDDGVGVHELTARLGVGFAF